MAMNSALTVSVDCGVIVLSGESAIYKTERFMKETRRFTGVDSFIHFLAGALFLYDKEYTVSAPGMCLRLDIDDHSFYIKTGENVKNSGIHPKDLIFFAYGGKEETVKRNDSRLTQYIKSGRFSVTIRRDVFPAAESGFQKLYRLSGRDEIYFPLLSEAQRKIVETEDKNMLVQGVAGSGKTNVCISKIIYTACRSYAGKLLYTTFSRGLLTDTHMKIAAFVNTLNDLIASYRAGNVVFADNDRRKALENYLALTIPDESLEKMFFRLQGIASYLENKVDYFLIEDLGKSLNMGGETVADEHYFIKTYLKNIKNHQLSSRLAKISYLSYEVIYKEIYGMVSGCCDPENPMRNLSLNEYTDKRKDSFNRSECEIIYYLAKDYAAHMEAQKLTDNNVISRKIIGKNPGILYSLAIIDEVQDMTEVNLCMLKAVARKMFCVGDALQMINPSYFSFAYVKRLLYEKDTVDVAELVNNYRNNTRIVSIIDSLSAENVARFGTHSFVLKCESVDTLSTASAVYVKEKGFLEAAAEQKFENFTVVVTGAKQKEELRKIFKKQEILTVSEIKGLEREAVVLYNILSDNADKWHTLERMLINRKQADENSVYRYYFNLFYVGLSRAKNHLFVAETKTVAAFERFFTQNFDCRDVAGAIQSLSGAVSRIEADDDEILDRVKEFIKLGQYDNARFQADRITDGLERQKAATDIDIHERFISKGLYREAGVQYWEAGRLDDARAMFSVSGDKALNDLIDATSSGENSKLDADIIRYLPEVDNNAAAVRLILQVIKEDIKSLTETQRAINRTMTALKEKKHG